MARIRMVRFHGLKLIEPNGAQVASAESLTSSATRLDPGNQGLLDYWITKLWRLGHHVPAVAFHPRRAQASRELKRAIISDIHGNLEALQAVLGDMREQGVEEIFCLGDIIGYGPNPCECLDLVIENVPRVPAGQPRPGGAVRSGRIQHGRGAGDLLDARSAGEPARRPWRRSTAAGIFWAPCRACTATASGCSCTARRAIRSTNMSFRKTSTIRRRWRSCSAWSSSAASRATRTCRACSPRAATS